MGRVKRILRKIKFRKEKKISPVVTKDVVAVANIEPKRKLETKGLPNIGNTCYMNTALQVFVNIPCIVKYLLSEDKKENGSFCKIMIDFIEAYWSKSDDDLKKHLIKIKNFIASKTNQFEGNDQQDSNEFFLYLLEIIHEEEKQCVTDLKPDMSEITGCDLEYLEYGKHLWDTYLKYNFSIITQKFYYMLFTKQKCLNESHLAIKFDVFSCITLPIPSNDTNHVSLDACFQKFMESTVEECYCTECKKKCYSDTKTCFLNLPDVLFLQLKRFKYHFLRKLKDTTLIDFSAEIDLSKYVDDTSDTTWKYQLIAFSDHEGSLYWGHYTAHIRDLKENKWHYLSDIYKEEVNIEELSVSSINLKHLVALLLYNIYLQFKSNTVFYLVYKRIKTESVRINL